MTRSLLVLALALCACRQDYDLNRGNDDNPGDTSQPDPEDYDHGAIHGRICIGDGVWAGGARVWVDSDVALVEATTESDGWFTLADVPVGPQTVWAEKGSFRTSFEVVVAKGETTEVPTPECLRLGDTKVAVVMGEYDSIQVVLDRLGITDQKLYDGVNGDAWVRTLLLKPDELAKYDVLFINCGVNSEWNSFRDKVSDNLTGFVEAGGSLYVSDLSYGLAELVDPDMIDFIGDDAIPGDAWVGVRGQIVATVTDPDMRAALGRDTADILFDLPAWAAIEQVGTGTELLHGIFEWRDFGGERKQHEGPLAVRHQLGAGTVIFTSFHNEQQNTDDMDVLLHEMILSL